MRSLQPPDILWIHWRVHNFIVNTSKRVLFLPPSDAYVRSFLYLLYTLIKLYYTKALSDQALSLAPDWILLLQGPRILVYSRDSTTTFQSSLMWKDPDAGKDWRQEEKGTTEDEMVGWHHWFLGHEFGWTPELVMNREAWRAAVHGVTKSWIRLSNWTELNRMVDECHSCNCIFLFAKIRYVKRQWFNYVHFK